MPHRTRSVIARLLLAALVPGCGGVAWDTTVADRAEVRRQMLTSVDVGRTTETAFVTRWGPPLQKVREGARVDYVYRRQGAHDRFVIVTFDYGLAVGARSNDFELCRATFPQRVPGFGFDRPETVRPAGTCGPSGGVIADGYGAGPSGIGGGAPYGAGKTPPGIR